MQQQYRIVGLLSLAAVLLTTLIIALPAAAQEEPPCFGLPECYEIPTATPSPGSSGSSSSPIWTGYSDGRLNPAMDEYYSVWCVNTFLEIWRGVPTSSLLSMVPIWLLEGLSENGGTVMVADFSDDPGIHPLTIRRSGDTITVSGDNGNLAPQPGSKSFNLNECIARDGHTAQQRGSGQGQTPFGSMHVSITVCYSPTDPQVLLGRIPGDQICHDNSNIIADTGVN